MLELTEHDRVLLRLQQRTQRKKKDYVKITAILMLDAGFSAEATATALGIDPSTVYRYCERFKKTGSLEEYLQTDYRGSVPALSPEQIEVLLEEMTTKLYRTAAEVGAFISNRFAVRYSERSVRALLNRLGFCYKKTHSVAAKADPIEQSRFLRRRLLPLLKRAKKRGEPVYFCDAVHPQYNTRAACGWIAAGELWQVPTTSTRQRLNLHGALNAEDPTDVLVSQSRSINTDSAITFFKQLQQHHSARRIQVICDNASYYRSKDLRRWLKRQKKHRIVVTYLPTCSPNLNLIERLWKYLRSEVIDTTYYRSFQEFTSAIMVFFKNIKQHRTKLTSLCTLNFHIYESLAF